MIACARASRAIIGSMNDTTNANPVETSTTDTTEAKPKRGFALLSKEAQRAIASKGGKAAHANGTAHRYTSEDARIAGAKGGSAPHRVRGRGPAKAPSSGA